MLIYSCFDTAVSFQAEMGIIVSTQRAGCADEWIPWRKSVHVEVEIDRRLPLLDTLDTDIGPNLKSTVWGVRGGDE